MDSKKNVVLPQPYLEAYPEPSNVFSDPVEQYALHMLPLVSIDLDIFNPDWNARVHIVSPIEPIQGCLGDHTRRYWNDFLCPNWLGFRLTEDNKYQLLGDFRFFAAEHPEGTGTELWRGACKEVISHYPEAHRDYESARARFLKYNQLVRAPRSWETTYRPDLQNPIAALEFLGYVPSGGEFNPNLGYGLNYSEPTKFNPVAEFSPNCGLPVDASIPEYPVPMLPNGDRFCFIASVPAWRYKEGGADSLVLFYEPKSRTVLIALEFS